jgi:N-acetyl-gamma-glutamyl-phosphate reductase
MAYRAGIVGASGYTGAELLRLLAGHPDLDVALVTADSNAGHAVAELYPSLAPAYPAVVYEALDPGALDGLDVVFLALPHGESQQFVPKIADQVGHIVDLGADFRLAPSDYATWYGEAHGAPELCDQFAYGLPELFRFDMATVDHVAAPGCYPTASALALAPLLAGGFAEPTGIVVDAVSGVSGAGRSLKATSLFAEVDENVQAYGLLDHRHTGEIQHGLGRACGPAGSGVDVQVLFTPHHVPMTRGILATCYARPAQTGLSTAALLDVYRAFYADEVFVTVTDNSPATKATLGSNSCHVTVRYDERTDTLLALGALDNLVKGASGQAIQATNILLGLPEDTGLPTLGLMP